jgi:hypothetical protein
MGTGLVTSLLSHGYCNRACLPLLNVVHEQPRLHFCPTSLNEIGRNHVIKFHTNFGVVQHHGESSPSPATVPRCCWMVWYHFRTWCISSQLLDGEGHFLCGFFFKMFILLWSSGSNGPGDITSCPLLLRNTAMVIPVFWRYLLPPHVLAEHHIKVVIHSHSPSLPPSPLGCCHVSKLQQQSNGHPTRKESVWLELPCPSQLEPSNQTREPSPHVL